jgi:hypothetical protein
VKGSLEVKLKLDWMLGWPKLQIAITGFTTGVENVIVLTFVFPPVNRIMPPVLSGGLPIVPPLNVLTGVQLGYPADRPFNCPEKVTLTPRLVIVPAVFDDHVVQSIVEAEADCVTTTHSMPMPTMQTSACPKIVF